MAYAMTKQGSLDNCVTYEFICDTVTDMNAIENRYRTIGTVAIVLQGSGGLEVYIAGSDKQWNSLGAMGGSSSGGTTIIENGLSIHICSQNEVRFGKPNVGTPDDKTIYLVPAANSETGNLYEEYIYVNNNWEKFGSGGSNIDLSDYVTYQDLDRADYATYNDLNGYASLDNNGKVSMEQLPLPTITSNDNGKILQVRSGELIADNLSYNFCEPKTWVGLTDFYGRYVWTDGENIYYSADSRQYILDISTSTWQLKSWNGLAYFDGCDIWTDGENTYYSGRPDNSYNYKYRILDKSTSTWQSKTWNGFGNGNFSGEDVWTDGENIYRSRYSVSSASYQYVLDKATSTWSEKIWNGLTSFDKINIWTDGENYYYSAGSQIQYVLDKATSTWNAKTWNGTTDVYGEHIWTDGEDIYYTYLSSHYVLDKTTSTWQRKAWQGPSTINNTSVWTDGENYYYSYGSEQYILSSKEKKILIGTKGEFNSVNVSDFITEYVPPQVEVVNNLTTTITGKALDATQGKNLDQNKINKQINNIIPKNWTGLTNFSGSGVWTDGENIYYSQLQTHYVLDKSTSTWQSKTWNGLTNFSGVYVWTDGENIYYSDNTTTNNLKQYVLDKTTSTWSEKTWNGLTDFSGGSWIWTDGDNIYYSNASQQYILDKATSTWSVKAWNGLTNFYGYNIWSDGENIYYSNYSNQYILDKSTSTWRTKTWNGLTNFGGDNVWIGGENIYYSYSTQQYVLDKSTSTWSRKTWSSDSLVAISTSNLWTDGDNIYLSYNSNQYEIFTDDIILLASNNTFEPTSVKKLTKMLTQEFPRIPTPPATDGTYTLQVVVSNGTPTYSWV